MDKLSRPGSIQSKGEKGISVQVGNAPPFIVPSRNYYGRRRSDDRVVPGHGATWGQLTGPPSDSARCVVVRENRTVQVGDAPAFTVTGDIGFRSYRGHVATYQNGVLVRRGSVIIPPNKFLGNIDSGNFITLETAAIAPITETLVFVPGAGSIYFLEDTTQKTVPSDAIADLILVPSYVPVVKEAVPTSQAGKVVVPNNAIIQTLPAPITWTVYEIQSQIVTIADGYMLVNQP